jgi:hypothetical protein
VAVVERAGLAGRVAQLVPLGVVKGQRVPAEPAGIAIGLLGDVMLGRMVAAALEHQPPETMWAPELRELPAHWTWWSATSNAAPPRAADRPNWSKASRSSSAARPLGTIKSYRVRLDVSFKYEPDLTAAGADQAEEWEHTRHELQ